MLLSDCFYGELFLHWEKAMVVFCIEDDPVYGKLLNHRLSLDPEFEVTIFKTASELLTALPHQPDIITMDVNLPGIGGVELLEKIREKLPKVIVLAISGQEDVKVAASLFRLGLYDYIVKDENTLDRLWNVIHNAASIISLNKEVEVLREEVESKYDLNSDLRGASTEMQNVMDRIKKSLNSDINVVVTGETGTGKELVAKTIHFNSKRKKGPFVAVNVAAIPNELIESELFGHEKGAFTGAHQQRIGKFEEARGGTLLLDEIGEMDITVQAKILRALQEMEINRVGGNKIIKLDFRLIIATHRDLIREVREGNFREDLYYRLMGLSISIPPLRDRNKDVIILANYFGEQFAKKNNLPIKKISKEAIRVLMNYPFPGNIRELRAIMETAIVVGEGEGIEAEDLHIRSNHEIDVSFKSGYTLEDYTNAVIQKTLEENNNNVIKTASKLDIGKSTIYRLIKEGKINNL